MNRVMLDLETLGTTPGSIIVSIGAVRFDEGSIGDQFYQRIDVTSAEKLGFTMDAKTVLWWMAQSDAARGELSGGHDIHQVLGWLSVWLLKSGEVDELWGNGVDFDNAFLAAAYKKIDQPQPWPFWANRCFRTVKALHPEITMERSGTHHNALHDAIVQAMHLLKIEQATAAQ